MNISNQNNRISSYQIELLIASKKTIDFIDIKMENILLANNKSNIILGYELSQILKIITKNFQFYKVLNYFKDKHKFHLEFNLICFLQDLSNLFVDRMVKAPNKLLYIFLAYKFAERIKSCGLNNTCRENIFDELATVEEFDKRLIRKIQDVYGSFRQNIGKLI